MYVCGSVCACVGMCVGASAHVCACLCVFDECMFTQKIALIILQVLPTKNNVKFDIQLLMTCYDLILLDSVC